MGLEESHSLADDIEAQVKKTFPNMDIIVHVEPATPAK